MAKISGVDQHKVNYSCYRERTKGGCRVKKHALRYQSLVRQDFSQKREMCIVWTKKTNLYTIECEYIIHNKQNAF